MKTFLNRNKIIFVIIAVLLITCVSAVSFYCMDFNRVKSIYEIEGDFCYDLIGEIKDNVDVSKYENVKKIGEYYIEDAEEINLNYFITYTYYQSPNIDNIYQRELMEHEYILKENQEQKEAFKINIYTATSYLHKNIFNGLSTYKFEINDNTLNMVNHDGFRSKNLTGDALEKVYDGEFYESNNHFYITMIEISIREGVEFNILKPVYQ